MAEDDKQSHKQSLLSSNISTAIIYPKNGSHINVERRMITNVTRRERNLKALSMSSLHDPQTEIRPFSTNPSSYHQSKQDLGRSSSTNKWATTVDWKGPRTLSDSSHALDVAAKSVEVKQDDGSKPVLRRFMSSAAQSKVQRRHISYSHSNSVNETVKKSMIKRSSREEDMNGNLIKQSQNNNKILNNHVTLMTNARQQQQQQPQSQGLQQQQPQQCILSEEEALLQFVGFGSKENEINQKEAKINNKFSNNCAIVKDRRLINEDGTKNIEPNRTAFSETQDQQHHQLENIIPNTKTKQTEQGLELPSSSHMETRFTATNGNDHNLNSSGNERRSKDTTTKDNNSDDYAKRLAAVRERIQRVRNGMRNASIDLEPVQKTSIDDDKSNNDSPIKDLRSRCDGLQPSNKKENGDLKDQSNDRSKQMDGFNNHRNITDSHRDLDGKQNERKNVSADAPGYRRRRISLGRTSDEDTQATNRRSRQSEEKQKSASLPERRSSSTLDGLHNKLAKLRTSFRKTHHSKEKNSKSTVVDSSDEIDNDLKSSNNDAQPSRSLPSSRKVSTSEDKVVRDHHSQLQRRKSSSALLGNKGNDNESHAIIARLRRSFRKSKHNDKSTKDNNEEDPFDDQTLTTDECNATSTSTVPMATKDAHHSESSIVLRKQSNDNDLYYASSGIHGNKPVAIVKASKRDTTSDATISRTEKNKTDCERSKSLPSKPNRVENQEEIKAAPQPASVSVTQRKTTVTTRQRKISSVSVRLKRGTTICLGDKRLNANNVEQPIEIDIGNVKPISFDDDKQSINKHVTVNAISRDEIEPSSKSDQCIDIADKENDDEQRKYVLEKQSVPDVPYKCKKSLEPDTDESKIDTMDSSVVSDDVQVIKKPLPSTNNSDEGVETHPEESIQSLKFQRKQHMRQRRQRGSVDIKTLPSKSPEKVTTENKETYPVVSLVEDKKVNELIKTEPTDNCEPMDFSNHSHQEDKQQSQNITVQDTSSSEKKEQIITKSTADSKPSKGTVKDRIRNRKFNKERLAHSKSLPSGIDQATLMDLKMLNDSHNVDESQSNLTEDTQSQSSKGSTTKDDMVTYRRTSRRKLRERPKTLTNGLDSEELRRSGYNVEVDIETENLSFADIKKKFLSGQTTVSTEKKTEKKTAKRARSGKRYKTITEGIAPSMIEEAKRLAQQDKEEGGPIPLDKLNKALTLSSERLNRKSFVVDEQLSNGRKRNMSSSSDHGAMFATEIQIETHEPAADAPSVSSLKARFLQAVDDSNTKHKQSPVKRRLNRTDRRSRPHTISGIDDMVMKQLQMEISIANEVEDIPSPDEKIPTANFNNLVGHDDSLSYLFEDICRKEGMSMNDLSKHLEDNLDDLLLSPVVGRKEPAATTVKESSESNCEIKMSESNKAVEVDAHSSEGVSKSPPVSPVQTVESVSKGMSDPFGDIDMDSSKLLVNDTSRRHLRPGRKTRGSSNPVKMLNARADVFDVPSEKPNEVKKVDASASSYYRGRGGQSDTSVGKSLWRKVALANEAKAALMSNEDFSKVTLKRAPQVKQKGANPADEEVTTSFEKLLLQVKGRRKVQTSVVDTSCHSLNSGDCYVLVLPKEIYCWCGKTSNVIERAKATEIASRIHQKKEMGCKALAVTQVEQMNAPSSRFYKALDDTMSASVADADSAASDAEFEKNAISTYMVYEIADVEENPSLVPHATMCSRMPSRDILDSQKAFVFDFVSEMYVWYGRQTTAKLRRTVQQLAKQRYDNGYLAHTSAHPNVGGARRISLSVEHGMLATHSSKSSMSKRSEDRVKPRPEWSIFIILYEQSEWVIFKEKFCDWPDDSRIIRMKGGPEARGEVTKAVAPLDIKLLDPALMVAPLGPMRAIVLESTDVGRGRGLPKGIDGYHVITKRVEVWHISDNRHVSLPFDSIGQFHSGEGYVIRWEYRVVASRLIRSVKDIETAGGRQRFCYFFWLGNDCSVNEQGATAVMTVELDKEKGPQVRVLQGKEPPHFLNLFNGGMIIHAGKRPGATIQPELTDRSMIRLYCIRGVEPSEGCLLQVPPTCESLRSRSSYLLVLCQQSELFLWHGCLSSTETRNTAKQCAQRMIENHPGEAYISQSGEIFLTEIEECEEPDAFWIALGGKEDYGSLVNESIDNWQFTPRLFHLSSATGEMIANEIASPSRMPSINCPFPILQDDLYNVDQPALFILDTGTDVYLWLGWWPDDEETEASASMMSRWEIDQQKAMQSTMLFLDAAGRSRDHAFVVNAGLEPDCFIDLFPYWVTQDDVSEQQIERDENIKDINYISEELKRFSKDCYSLEELKKRPPPHGLDATKLEKYLSDVDFIAIFRLDRATFNEQPSWKQANLKRRAGLY